ncbi:MAG: hypothetical protein C4551_01555 [Bacillota bacterium]|nr:MAG: hypothetical protein C4551_01555 [Bacillota bacterium]
MARPERQLFERVRVVRERAIPLPGDVMVSAGDHVNPQDLIARAETVPGDPYVVDLRAELGQPKIGPEEVAKLMLKRVGDRVQAREPIARNRVGVFGDIYEAYSPVDGFIEFISHAYARVLIREDAQKAAPVVIVNVAKKLDVSPMMIRAYIRCREGDEVRQGAIIADSPGGVGIDYCYAPASGTIEKICSRTGTVTILRPAKPTEIDAYLQGRVSSVIPERGAVVEATASFVQGVFGLGFENHGTLRAVTGSPDAVVTAEDVTADDAGCILIGGAGVTLDALRKAVDIGVKGLVTGGANHGDLASLLGREIGVGITGQEDLPLTLVVTEGFGVMPMSADTYELLRSAEGRLVSVNGSTQVRAGVRRPEVIIPRPDEGQTAARLVEECLAEREHERGEPAVGSKVRIVRNPKFGLWGEIVGLPADPVRFETEACLPSAEVVLETGERLFVPLANLEVF